MSTQEEWKNTVEIRLKGVDDDIHFIRESMVAATTQGVEQALRNVLKDKQLTEEFWRRGFDELSTHAQNDTSKWLGKRILAAFVAAAVTYGIIWLVKTGNIK